MKKEKKKKIPFLLLTVALLSAAYRVHYGSVPALANRQVAYQATAAGAPVVHTDNLSFLPAVAPSVHAATLALLRDGTVACAWFAGSREGARDVAIYYSLLRDGRWSWPLIIADPSQTSRDTARYIRKVGNPVLACDVAGRLHLWYVSTSVGGWSTSALNHRVSADGGASWSRAKRMVTAPFFNLSTLVRTQPLPLLDGGFALPSYHELFTKHGEMLRLDSRGMALDKQRMPGGGPLLQPAVAPIPEKGEFLALLRNAGPKPRRIAVAALRDGEDRWFARPHLPLANPDSSVALLRLNDGRLLLACNPLTDGRQRLSLFLSPDFGRNWLEAFSVEDSPVEGGEFSYPSLLQDREGIIHLAYTWNRRKIAHRMISLPAPAGLEVGKK
ncbi:MAG: hypothetical protein A4E69_02861 [Syntrophus sp. PtaB.Bin138]|nr:MAG: hypothetical protein A4E69_02861 [Syntrophus sp. PtaB.Bin138]